MTFLYWYVYIRTTICNMKSDVTNTWMWFHGYRPNLDSRPHQNSNWRMLGRCVSFQPRHMSIMASSIALPRPFVQHVVWVKIKEHIKVLRYCLFGLFSSQKANYVKCVSISWSYGVLLLLVFIHQQWEQYEMRSHVMTASCGLVCDIPR